MNASPAQLGLFDFNQVADKSETVAARTRMRDMIERLRSTSTPPWKDQMASILDDGAFQRAMRLVPAEEAQALWAEYDAEAERLNEIWIATLTKSAG